MKAKVGHKERNMRTDFCPACERHPYFWLFRPKFDRQFLPKVFEVCFFQGAPAYPKW